MTDRKLVIIRGNSGSGKTSVAREIRTRYGRGRALIEQDHFRRIVLREHDSSNSGGIAPEFIANSARFALDHGYHVVLEGILGRVRYAPALSDLIAGHPGESHVFYMDVSFDETSRRVLVTRPMSAEVTAEQMREWYEPHDVLGIAGEHVMSESSTFAETVAHVLDASGLLDTPATTYCPSICPRCRAVT